MELGQKFESSANLEDIALVLVSGDVCPGEGDFVAEAGDVLIDVVTLYNCYKSTKALGSRPRSTS